MKEGQIRAVAYARAGTCLPTTALEELRQLAQIRVHCVANGILLVDSVVSGGSRASLEAIVNAAASPGRTFDAVVVTCETRLSRDMAELEQVRAQLAKVGVTIIAVAHPAKVGYGLPA